MVTYEGLFAYTSVLLSVIALVVTIMNNKKKNSPTAFPARRLLLSYNCPERLAVCQQLLSVPKYIRFSPGCQGFRASTQGLGTEVPGSCFYGKRLHFLPVYDTLRTVQGAVQRRAASPIRGGASLEVSL